MKKKAAFRPEAATGDDNNVAVLPNPTHQAYPSRVEQVNGIHGDMGDWLTEPQLAEWLQVSVPTCYNMRHRGELPYVQLSGGRRIIYHRASVEKALLRRQRGGES